MNDIENKNAAPPSGGAIEGPRAPVAGNPAFKELAKKAEKKIGKRGRPYGGGGGKNQSGSGRDAGGASLAFDGDAGGAPTSPAFDLARDVYMGAVDAVRGYREIGFAVTGHDHWKKISDERVEAGARAVVDAMAKMPPESAAKIMAGLVWSRFLFVGAEVFVMPVVKSLRLNKEGKQAAAAAGTGEPVVVNSEKAEAVAEPVGRVAPPPPVLRAKE